jgi:ParB family chromosome partitioning protein
MNFREETIALARIDHGDDAFRITTRSRTDDLRPAIAVIGLLRPPIVIETSAAYRIISGFRRIAACREIGWERVRARVLPASTDPLHCVQLAVAENALQRPLDLIEQSRGLNLLAAVMADPTRMADTAAVLGLPAHPSLIQKIMPLCRLPAPIQDSILDGTISLPMAEALQRHDLKTAVAVAGLFAELKLGLNRQREVLTLLEEIAEREDRRLLDVLTESSGRLEIGAPEDGVRRSRRLIELLKRRRYPNIHSRADAFQRRLARLALDSGVRIKPPPHFESGVYTLAFTFTTVAELSKRLERLGELIDHPSFKRLLD